MKTMSGNYFYKKTYTLAEYLGQGYFEVFFMTVLVFRSGTIDIGLN